MNKSILSLFLLPTLAMPLAASAAEQMKPGLWEMTMKSDMMKSMPQIPPEQLEQMRKMGVKMPQMQNGGMVSKVCITKQMAESNQPPGMNNNELGCQSKNYQRNGGNYSVDIVCNGDMKGEGKIKGTMASDQGFSSTYDFKGSAYGQPVSQHHETSGKWLSTDCGSVKPVGAAMPAK